MTYSVIAGLKNKGAIVLYREGKWADAAKRMEELKNAMDRANARTMIFASDWNSAVRADEVTFLRIVDDDMMKGDGHND